MISKAFSVLSVLRSTHSVKEVWVKLLLKSWSTGIWDQSQVRNEKNGMEKAGLLHVSGIHPWAARTPALANHCLLPSHYQCTENARIEVSFGRWTVKDAKLFPEKNGCSHGTCCKKVTVHVSSSHHQAAFLHQVTVACYVELFLEKKNRMLLGSVRIFNLRIDPITHNQYLTMQIISVSVLQ